MLALLVIMEFSPSVASAPTPGGGTGGGSSSTITCSGTIKAGVCFPGGTGLSEAPVADLLIKLMNWLLAIFGFLAIIAFVISGIQYFMAAGDEKTAETAKRNMKYSIIGIVVTLSGWIIIQAIDSALSGSSVFF